MLVPVSRLSGVFIDHLQQFVVHGLSLLVRPALNGMGSAMREMIAHQRTSDRPDGLLRRRDLRENVSAVAVFFYHPLQATHLSFDTAQPPKIRGLDRWIDANRFASGRICIEYAGVLP